MNLLIPIGLTLALLFVAAAALGIARLIFAARVDDLRAQLFASQQASGPTNIQLPEIVRSYAVRAGGRVGAPPVLHARQVASLATSAGRPPIEIEAEQWTGIVTPGLVWSAHGRMNGLPVTVFDAFVEGRGELAARILGVFRVAGGSGPDFDKGELQRYLSELPVYPDAILNNHGLVWRQLDERTVEVMARSKSGPASLRLVFDETGDIVGCEANDRPMVQDGTTVPTQWRGVFADYTQFGRYRIPARGEVGWVLDDGLFTYWRGKIVSYGPSGAAAP